MPRNGEKPKRRWRKSGYYSVRRLNVNQWPEGLQSAFGDRMAELEGMHQFDLVRDRGLMVQIVYWECLANVLRQRIAETGPLYADGTMDTLVKELRLIDQTLLKLYQAGGMSPFVARQFLEEKPRSELLSDWIAKRAAEAEVEETDDDGKDGDDGQDGAGSDNE